MFPPMKNFKKDLMAFLADNLRGIFLERTLKFYIRLFFSVFMLNAFTVGGGYVIVPLMRKKYVEKLQWIGEEEMLDFTAIAQSSPGAIAVNCAILVGLKTGGVLGAVVALLGALAPSVISISLIYYAYAAFRDNHIIAALLEGLKIGAAAVIIDVVITMARAVFKQKSVLTALIMLAGFLLVYAAKINIVYVILGCIALGVLLTFRKGGGAAKEGGNAS